MNAMMQYSFRIFAILVTGFLMNSAGPLMASDSTYDRIYEYLQRQNHRQAGSENYNEAASVIGNELSRAGLQVYRQNYDGLIPESHEVLLLVEGQSVPALAMTSNGVGLNTTSGKTHSGKVVYCGWGEYSDLEGLDLRDSIAVLEMGSPHYMRIYQEGAKAIIYVGNDEYNLWTVRKSFTDLPVQLPRLYLDRETAQKFSLLDKQTMQSGSVKISSRMADVDCFNLWTVILGKSGKQYYLGVEEVIVLSATLDTLGAVPAFSPDSRMAANVALLAETAVQLSKEKPERTIVIVFYGSHFNQQEGARHFFYAYEKSKDSVINKDPLPIRKEYYEKELSRIESWIERLNNQEFYKSEDRSDAFYEVNKLIRQEVKNKQNEINIQIRDLYLRVKYENDQEAKKEITEFEATKNAWNDLLRQIHNQGIEQSPNKQFEVVRANIKNRLTFRKNVLIRAIRNNLSSQELSRVFQNKEIVTYLHYDFASDQKPWMLNALANTFSIYGDAEIIQQGTLLKHQSVLTEIYRSLNLPVNDEVDANLVSVEELGGIKMDGLSAPVERRLPISVGAANGLASFSCTTVGDGTLNDGMPRRVDVSLEHLAGIMTPFVKEISANPDLSLRSPLQTVRFNKGLVYTLNGDNPIGKRFQIMQKGGSEIEGPASGAIAYPINLSLHRAYSIPGHTASAMGRINSDGFLFMPQLSIFTEWGQLSAAGHDEFGQIDRVLKSGDFNRLFYGYGSSYYLSLNPVSYNFPVIHNILSARGNSRPRNFAVSASDRFVSFFVDKDEPIKVATEDYIMINAVDTSDGGSLGIGLQQDLSELYNVNPVAIAARDFTLLNENRLDRLRKKNIINDSIEVLHLGAMQHVENSNEARENGKIGEARAHDSFALALAQRAYEPLREMSNDMVYAVVILLILSMPFAFAMERLTIGATTIYRQMGYYMAYFALTFFTLYIVHPAFSLAKSPIVILLAFAIVLMSAIVIYLIMGKFKQEIKALQGLASKSHGTDSESSTAMSAVLIGIAGMRNRPLKTFLTSVTIVLLTFTILAFAAFNSKTEVIETYQGPRRGVDRIEIHLKTFLNIPNELIESIKTMYEKNFHTMKRRIVMYDPTRFDNYSPDLILYNPANDAIAKIDSVMGFEKEEFDLNPELKEIIPTFSQVGENIGTPGMFLSEFLSKRLSLSKGDKFTLNGQEFILSGSFESSRFSASSYLDNGSILPLDFKASLQNNGGAQQTKSAEDLEQMDTSSFRWSEPSLVAVTSNDSLKEFEYFDSGIQMYPKTDSADVDQTAREIAQIFTDPIYSSSSQGTKQFFFGEAVSGSGFADVLVPLLLGGLIIFSSLMGSIVDREKEIFTYSALGLAPPDVGMLFFAESAIYSVIGGMGGYLFSQVVAKLLSVAAYMGLFTPPEMNFSSLSSILTILIVMGVVMLSTIYPALKAGKSANPGVARKWRMPEPKDGKIEFLFPFTVSHSDIEGVLAFVKEHFDSHQDASLGLFSAQETRVFENQDGEYRSLSIESRVSLAPFDLGVSQHFKLYSQPSDIEGIEEVMVELVRENGSLGAWMRGNQDFINDLRNQFLLWRSLPEESIRHYKEATASEIKNQILEGAV